MRKSCLAAVLFVISVTVAGFTQEKPYPMSDSKGALVIADFNSWEEINNLGGMFAGWGKDPNDDTQGCRVELNDQEKVGDKGMSVRMVYDVDSPRTAFNGFWCSLESSDWSPYRYFCISVKGDKAAGFTPRFKIELKNKKGEIGRYVLTGITDQWKDFVIPLTSFRGLNKTKDMMMLTIVFDDMRCDPKVGALFIDNVYVSK